MVQSWYGLVVIENGYYKFNVFLVAYTIQEGGLMLLPRGGVSAWLKSQNNMPQLVLIWTPLLPHPHNFSRDPWRAQALNKLLQTMAAAKGHP